MGRTHYCRPASKRPPTRKQTEEARVNQQDVERWKRYIDNVRKTGIHWRHHVERLELKYPNNVFNVYTELSDNVKGHKAKKAAEKAKAEAKKLKTKPPTPSSTSNDGSTSSSSNASSKSGQTFLSTEVTQAMLEKARGRPRKTPRMPSKLSHKQPTHERATSRQASQANNFSLSKVPSPAHDDALLVATSFDNVDPATCADFFSSTPPPAQKEKKRRNVVLFSDAESPSKRVRRSISRQVTTEPLSITKQAIRGTDHYENTTVDASEKYGDTSLGHHAVQAASRLSRANASREDFNDIGIPAQAMPSNSQVSIGSALDELMNEDGAACNVIALEKPVLPISVTSSTSSTRKSASPKEPQPALPSGGGRKTSSKGISSPLRSIVEPVHQRVNDNSFSESIAPSAVSTTQSASLETSQTVSNEANNKVLTSQTEIDPDIASIIRKPGGVASFLNNLAPSFQREHIMRQGHEDDGLGGQAIQTNNADDLASIEPLDELFGDNVYTPADAIIYPTVPEPADNLDTSETAGNGVLAGAGRSLSTRCAEVDAPLEGANQPTAICQTYAARSSSAAPQLQALAIEQAGMPIAYASHATPTDTMRKALQPIGPYVQHTKATSSQNISDNSTLNSLAIANLKINPIFIKVLSDNAFVNISDLAEARMNRDDIRLLVASIQEEQKISKSETIVAILRLDAALQRFQQQKRMAH